MLQDVLKEQQQLQQEEEQFLMEEALNSIPIASQLLNFSDDAELFPRDLLQSSVNDVPSTSASVSASAMTIVDGTNSSASVDFSPFLPSMDHTAFSCLLNIQPPPDPTPDDLLNAITDDYGYANTGYPLVGPPPEFDDYVGVDTTLPSTSSSYLFSDSGIGGSVYGGGMSNPVCGRGVQGQQFFSRTDMMVGPTAETGMVLQEMEGVQGQQFFSRTDMMVRPTAETGMALQEMAEYLNDVTARANYGMESMQHGYNPVKMKVLGDCQQQQPLASDQSTLEEYPTFKVGRLSAEERKEKINRYMRKRNERNFSKKIKYACRKTLADSRPRVRGRFAKNEEFGETARPSSSNNEYNDDDDVLVKEEDIFDSSVMLAHISSVNSFSYKYTVESSM